MADGLAHCAVCLAGDGRVELQPGGARLSLPASTSGRYRDAQFDDYAHLRRRQYRHRPPLRLSLQARFSHASHALRGTAGFGFWNNPFGPQTKTPALPQAVWFFFASPPSNMSLAQAVPGHGWKAACLDAGRASALAWAPIAPLVLLACRSTQLARRVWPRVQRALGIAECALDADVQMTEWHTYELQWLPDGARWWVDGRLVLETDRSPRGPLGLVVWIDNQYAVVTPRGNFKFGLVDAPVEQWLDVREVSVTRGE